MKNANQYTVARLVTHETAGKSKGIQYDNIPGIDSGPVSVAFWAMRVETQTVDQHMMVVDQTASDADDGGVGFIQDGSPGTGMLFVIRGTSDADVEDANTPLVNTGVWVHYVGTYGGVFGTSDPKIYRNGVNVGSSTTAGSGSRSSAPGSHSIGGRESTVERGAGCVIAGVGRWQRELSPAEVKLLANGMHPLDMHSKDLVLCPNFLTLENMAPGAARQSLYPNLIEQDGLSSGPPVLRPPKARQPRFALVDPLPQTRVLDVPHTGLRPKRQPSLGPEIDWTNPLTSGLTCALVFTGNRVVDLCLNRTDDSATALPTLNSNANGWVKNNNGNAFQISPNGSFDTYAIEYGAGEGPAVNAGSTEPGATVFVVGRFLGNNFDGPLFLTQSNQGIRFDDDDSEKPFLFSGAVSANKVERATAVGEHINVALSHIHAGQSIVMCNGEYNQQTDGGYSFTGNINRIGRFSGQANMTFDYSLFLVWGSTPLSAQQLLQLNENPWQIFKRDDIHVPIEYQELTFDSDSEERLFMIPQRARKQPR